MRPTGSRPALRLRGRCPAGVLREQGATWRAESTDRIVACFDVPSAPRSHGLKPPAFPVRVRWNELVCPLTVDLRASCRRLGVRSVAKAAALR